MCVFQAGEGERCQADVDGDKNPLFIQNGLTFPFPYPSLLK